MKVFVHAVGRMKAGPEQDLAARYFERFGKAGALLGLDFAGVTEIAESRATDPRDRKRDESERLDAFLPAGAVLIVLDERGRNLTSQAFADLIASHRDQGAKALVLAIGGPDGHDRSVLGETRSALSFGAATWPHQIMRVMLAEQLYRAATILSGHPYHRA